MILRSFILVLTLTCCSSIFGATPKLEDIHVALMAYPESESARLFIEQNRVAAIEAVRNLIHGKADYGKLDTSKQLDLIVALDPNNCLKDLIHVASSNDFWAFQVHAIELMAKLGDEECLTFLYSCLKPGDARTVEAIRAMKMFKITDYKKIISFIKTDKAAWSDSGELHNGIEPPDYGQAMSAAIHALSWSADKECLDFVRELCESSSDESITAPAGGVLLKLEIYFDPQRNTKLREIYAAGLFKEWIEFIVEREGLKNILPE